MITTTGLDRRQLLAGIAGLSVAGLGSEQALSAGGAVERVRPPRHADGLDRSAGR